MKRALLAVALASAVLAHGHRADAIVVEKIVAIVGDKPNCFKWAFPMSGMMKVVMTVSQGSGVAAAQVFEK